MKFFMNKMCIIMMLSSMEDHASQHITPSGKFPSVIPNFQKNLNQSHYSPIKVKTPRVLPKLSTVVFHNRFQVPSTGSRFVKRALPSSRWIHLVLFHCSFFFRFSASYALIRSNRGCSSFFRCSHPV